MCANIAQRERWPCLFRIKAPLSSRAGFLDLDIVPAECKAHIDDADLAQIAVFDHLPRLLDQLVAGITVGYADNALLFLCQANQLVRLCRGKAQRLFAYDMQPRFERLLANFIVHAVRRCD